jgi:hypothetical protein
MSDQLDQRWTFGTPLDVDAPVVGTVKRTNEGFTIILESENQSVLIYTPIPTPNVIEGWKVKAVMLRYRIFGVNDQPVTSIFDTVLVWDGDQMVPGFPIFLNIGMPTGGIDTGWKTAKVELPVPANFQFGLGVSIQANHISGGLANVFPAVFEIASVGLEFIKPGVV